MGNSLRLRGPWIVRGGLLDTSVSSQGGSIAAGGSVALVMSAYTFMPDMLGRDLFSFLDVRVRIALLGLPNADSPRLALINESGSATTYLAEWRHINP
ncbi:hypothetical protein LCGC14_2398130 [marine sediment metagenome]|uniref:Uncharacterized protein n=1 Tax=marine sediment metagenome TaxID=412755 RepID=A0A0F9E8H4_9ZZZZ